MKPRSTALSRTVHVSIESVISEGNDVAATSEVFCNTSPFQLVLAVVMMA